MRALHRYIIAAILASILFVSAHTLIHNVHDHDHFDSSCAVYALEELFVSSDAISTSIHLAIFVAFTFMPWDYSVTIGQVDTLFTIRAPPLV